MNIYYEHNQSNKYFKAAFNNSYFWIGSQFKPQGATGNIPVVRSKTAAHADYVLFKYTIYGSHRKNKEGEGWPLLWWLPHRKHFVFIEALHGKPVQGLVSTAFKRQRKRLTFIATLFWEWNTMWDCADLSQYCHVKHVSSHLDLLADLSLMKIKKPNAPPVVLVSEITPHTEVNTKICLGFITWDAPEINSNNTIRKSRRVHTMDRNRWFIILKIFWGYFTQHHTSHLTTAPVFPCSVHLLLLNYSRPLHTALDLWESVPR